MSNIIVFSRCLKLLLLLLVLLLKLLKLFKLFKLLKLLKLFKLLKCVCYLFVSSTEGLRPPMSFSILTEFESSNHQVGRRHRTPLPPP